jgi:hypothetical protein
MLIGIEFTSFAHTICAAAPIVSNAVGNQTKFNQRGVGEFVNR